MREKKDEMNEMESSHRETAGKSRQVREGAMHTAPQQEQIVLESLEN